MSSKREINHTQSRWVSRERVVQWEQSSERFRGYGLGFVPWGIIEDETVWERCFGWVSFVYTDRFLVLGLTGRTGCCRIDLDIESGVSKGYAAFVNRIRSLAKGAKKK